MRLDRMKQSFHDWSFEMRHLRVIQYMDGTPCPPVRPHPTAPLPCSATALSSGFFASIATSVPVFDRFRYRCLTGFTISAFVPHFTSFPFCQCILEVTRCTCMRDLRSWVLIPDLDCVFLSPLWNPHGTTRGQSQQCARGVILAVLWVRFFSIFPTSPLRFKDGDARGSQSVRCSSRMQQR